MHRVHLAAWLLAAASLASSGQAQTFTPIGGDSTRPTGMSPDGVWVSGWDRNGVFRWSAGSGFDSFGLDTIHGEPDVALAAPRWRSR